MRTMQGKRWLPKHAAKSRRHFNGCYKFSKRVRVNSSRAVGLAIATGGGYPQTMLAMQRATTAIALLVIAAEQAALTQAQLTVWLHPLYWYSVPGLMKHYFDKVLALGWAYGGNHEKGDGGGRALHGKHCLWVPSTGGDGEAYSATGIHANAFAEFVTPVEMTARFCGMFWQPPFAVHGAHVIGNDELSAKAEAFKLRLQDWLAVHGATFAAGEKTA